MAETPRLPPELEREILETTALLYPNTIPQLLRVARRVLSWIEPILYHRVFIPGLQEKSGNGGAILRALSTKPADFFSTAVRHLYVFAIDWTLFNSSLPNRWSDAELEKVLRACTFVVNLLLIGDLAKPPLLRMVAEMRPTRLVMLGDLMSPQLDLTIPFFHNLSHFFIGDISRRGGVMHANWPQLHNLAELRSLTHLALSNCTAPDVVSDLLCGCLRLRVLIVCTQEAIPALEGIDDCRLVLMVKTENIVEDWDLGIRGGKDIWVRADAATLHKRREEIEGDFRFRQFEK
ncbi:hypothetical protein MVEN_02214800 [Mycena venus]|uniref:Uncharacterized protein n=1 Tax=Mycena venus TaxID=2733690 RepID=A0A8H6X718_9AGAR|nr:hypothetical protein MVEN_02214800 [Mycena venus]